ELPSSFIHTFLLILRSPISSLFPYTTLFRSEEHFGQAACRVGTLNLEGAVQLALRQLARADQQLAQPTRRATPHGEDDRTLRDVDDRLVVPAFGADGQHSRLVRQVEQLQHVLDAQLLERPLDRHLSGSSPASARPARPDASASMPRDRRAPADAPDRS